MKIKQVFVPYWEWEDYLNGMWGPINENRIADTVVFTGDWVKYGEAMREVIEAWPRTMINSLTNKSINRRAFLGHCAVCYKLGITESTTRAAWKLLTDEQRFDADKIADKHIKHWEYEYSRSLTKVRKGLGVQMLLEWPTG